MIVEVWLNFYLGPKGKSKGGANTIFSPRVLECLSLPLPKGLYADHRGIKKKKLKMVNYCKMHSPEYMFLHNHSIRNQSIL